MSLLNLLLNVFINTYSFFILLMIYHQLKTNDESVKHRHEIFMKMVQLIMCLLILDIGSRFDGHPGTPIEIINRVSNFAIFVLSPLQAMLWVYYIKVQGSQDPLSLRRLSNGFKALLFGNLILNIANLKYHWLYSIDSANVYQRGPYFLMPVALTLILTLLSYWYAINYRESFTKKYFKALMLFALPPVVCIFLQYQIYGSSLILAGVVMSQLMVFISIQNQRVYTDFLTGVYNRTKLESYLNERIKITKRKGKTFSAILVDLDDFKNINDTLGHDIGDIALGATAAILKSCVRIDDMIARYGGDEFCIVLDIEDSNELENMVNKIQGKILSYNEQFNSPFRLELSMGYAVYDPSFNMTADDFQRLIDLKMYQEKRSRKSQIIS